ncbi:MAG: UbiX family flavin prenyltransferase, partial [Candidatus Hodarchaeota archaeon]
MMVKRLITAVTGASGAIYALRLLEILKEQQIESHLVVSDHGVELIQYELDLSYEDFQKKADVIHNFSRMDSIIASGSTDIDAMVIIPCSMHTVSAIAHGDGGNLITRAADVTLKEHRPLVLVPREMPFNAIHLRNMLSLSEMGVHIVPACPAFWHKPT